MKKEKQKITDKKIYFEQGDKVRIISDNLEGVVMGLFDLNMIYEKLHYRVNVGKYIAIVKVTDLEKIQINYGQLHFLYAAYIAILSNSHTQYVPP